MNVYLDDNLASKELAQHLRKAGHEVLVPSEAQLAGASDPQHFAFAIRNGWVFLTRDRDDFRDLHDLIRAAQGRHPGLLVVRLENDPRKDMRPRHIVQAIANILHASVPIENDILVLNHWR